LKVKERKLLKASVENLAASVTKAKEKIVEDQDKLAKIDLVFGERLK